MDILTELQDLSGYLTNLETELSIFFDMSVDMLSIVDNKGFYVKASKSWQTVLGWKTEEVLGQHYLELVHPEDLALADSQLAALVNKPVVATVVRVKNKLGEYRYISWSASKFYKGKTYVVGRDITNRINYQHELEAEVLLRIKQFNQQQLKTAAIVDCSPNAIIAMDKNGCVSEFNKTAQLMFGYTRDEALGKELADLIVPEELRDRHRAGFKRYLATGTSNILGKRIEMPALTKQGKTIQVELAISVSHFDGEPFFAAFLRPL